MYYYKIYGLRLESDLYFPQLVEDVDEKNSVDIIIIEDNIPDTILEQSVSIPYTFSDEVSWLNNSTTLLVVMNGRKIIYQAKTGFNPIYLRTYLLGFGLAMLFMQRRYPAIHCSSVKNDSGAILIAGESGAGKSTITSELLKQGYFLMADDMTVVSCPEGKQVLAYPGFPYQKLCLDAAMASGHRKDELIYIDEKKDKYLVPYTQGFDTNPTTVIAFILLTQHPGSEAPYLKQITGLNQLNLILGNLFLRKLLNQKSISPLFASVCLNIASKLPMYVISRPEQGDTIQIVTDMVRGVMKKK